MPLRKLVLDAGSLEASSLEAAGSEASWMAVLAAWRFAKYDMDGWLARLGARWAGGLEDSGRSWKILEDS